VILIRTFLSISLGVEIEGHWPWRRREIEKQFGLVVTTVPKVPI